MPSVLHLKIRVTNYKPLSHCGAYPASQQIVLTIVLRLLSQSTQLSS